MVGSSTLRAAAGALFVSVAVSALETVTDCQLVIYTSYGKATWIPDPSAKVSSKPTSVAGDVTTTSGWTDWDPAATTSKPVKVSTTSTPDVDYTWAEWDPATSTTAVVENTWSIWDPATSAAASTDISWSDWDPKTSTSTTDDDSWSDWDPKTSTTTSTSTLSSSGWGEWVDATSTSTSSSTTTPLATTTTTGATCEPTLELEICEEEDGSESTSTYTIYPSGCATTTASPSTTTVPALTTITTTSSAQDCTPSVEVEICDEEDGSESTYTYTIYPTGCATPTA